MMQEQLFTIILNIVMVMVPFYLLMSHVMVMKMAYMTVKTMAIMIYHHALVLV